MQASRHDDHRGKLGLLFFGPRTVPGRPHAVRASRRPGVLRARDWATARPPWCQRPGGSRSRVDQEGGGQHGSRERNAGKRSVARNLTDCICASGLIARSRSSASLAECVTPGTAVTRPWAEQHRADVESARQSQRPPATQAPATWRGVISGWTPRSGGLAGHGGRRATVYVERSASPVPHRDVPLIPPLSRATHRGRQ